MMVRILHVVGDSKFGGASVGILRLAQHWRSLNWDVELLVTDPAMLAAAANAGIPTVPLEVIWREIRPMRDLLGLYRLYRYLRANPYTIVHTHTTKAGLIGRLAAFAAGVPIVVHTAHGFAFHEASTKLKIAFYTFFERLASYCCSRVVAVSRFHRDWGIRLGMCPARKWVAISNGIPEPDPVSPESIAALRSEWGAAPDTLVILAHGRLAPEKGLEHLLQVAHRLKSRLRRPFLVLLAGEGPLRPELERIARSLDVEDRIRFLGFRRDVNELLAAADIVALPSLREGLSIALLEAMAMSRPIVATSIGSNREVTREGEGALLIPPNSPEALEAAIHRLAEDPQEARKLGQCAGEIFREEYTLDKMLGGYGGLYFSLLAGQGMRVDSRPELGDATPANTSPINYKENHRAESVSALLPSLDR